MNLKSLAPFAVAVALLLPVTAQAATPYPASPAAPKHSVTSVAPSHSLMGSVRDLNATSLVLDQGKSSKTLKLDKFVTFYPMKSAIKKGAHVRVETNSAGNVTSIRVVR